MVRVFLLFLVVCVSSPLLAAEKLPLRLRVTWGGEAPTLQGKIFSNAGPLRDIQPLGVEADAATCAWVVQGTVRIQQATSRNFNGFDVTVPYNAAGTLRLQFAVEGDLAKATWHDIPLEKLLSEGENILLGERDGKSLGQVSVTRVPGDMLRVLLERDSLVYRPGETFRCYVLPTLLKTSETQADLEMQLFRARETFEIWQEKKKGVEIQNAAPKHVEIPLPQEEGAYEIVLRLKNNRMGGVMEPLSKPLTVGPLSGTKLNPTQVLAERRIQVVVLAAEKNVPNSGTEVSKTLVMEIDPTQPRWWESLPSAQSSFLFSRWKRNNQESLGSGTRRTITTAIGPAVELPQRGTEEGVSWEAYLLTVKKPETPHLLEVEYPEGMEQSLGISLAEPNAAGAIIPMGLDSGVDVPANPLAEPDAKPQRWLRHRILFWPKSKTQVLLMTNRHATCSAFYGKIRILSLGEALPPMFSPKQNTLPANGRLIAPLFSKPLFPECFSATERSSSIADFTMDDWRTFLDGGNRMTEYLNYIGYNGVMLAVYADGSTIYPSPVLGPTPRYDSGVFLPDGQDPVRKDVLEMLLRQFDREKLTLIPALDFSAPIPELEAAIRFPKEADALKTPAVMPLRWYNSANQELTETLETVKNGAPYYNILDDAVQGVVLRSLSELIQRYGQHPSFGGVSLLLHDRSFLVLPPPEWGMDFATIAQFVKETQFALPEDYAQRVRVLSSGDGAKAWQAWRTSRLTLFYRRAASLLEKIPNAKLYLAGTDCLGLENHPELGPNLQRSVTASDVLFRSGLDAAVLSRVPNLVFPRPERVCPNKPLVQAVADLQWKQTPGTFRVFQGQSMPSSLFYHPVEVLRLNEFDEKSPFQPTFTWLATTMTPGGNAGARRYAESLAMMDAEAIFDGGWMPAMGQEDSVRETIRILRQLPAVRFHSAMMSQPNDTRSQPILFRSSPANGGNYAYAVNLTPFPMEGQVYLQPAAGSTFSTEAIPLGDPKTTKLEQDTRGVFWRVVLAPYQVTAIYFSGGPVVLYDPVAFFANEVQGALQQQYYTLQQHLQSLQTPALFLGLGNANFEDFSTSTKTVPDWTILSGSGDIDRSVAQSGAASLRLFSTGEPVRVQSRPFTVSPTGRLSITAWMCCREGQVPPTLLFSVEGVGVNQAFKRVADLRNYPQKIGSQWTPITIHVNDLPIEEGLELQIGLEMLGGGEVWIDNLMLSDMNFSAEEQQTLNGMFSVFGTRIQRGDVVPCLSILESYWMRFLKENVPLGVGLSPRSMATLPGKTPPSSPPLVKPKKTTETVPPAKTVATNDAPKRKSSKNKVDPQYIQEVPKEKTFLERVKGYLPW